jgi:Co/Zn/Cd efflux system component
MNSCGECGCGESAAALVAGQSAARRRVLWTVLLINAALFLGEFAAGVYAHSTALQADSLDSLGDALVYALSLAVVAGSLQQRAGAAMVKGVIQAMFAAVVIAEVVRRALLGSEPLAPVMAVAATVAFCANLACFGLLYRFRADDLNMRSVWLCSRNDLVHNCGLLVAAALVAVLGNRWPDLVVGALIAGLFLHTSVSVIREAWPQWRAQPAGVMSGEAPGG